jgi:cytosine deaminase
MGREFGHLTRRGVAPHPPALGAGRGDDAFDQQCAEPVHAFGDVSLMRMANLYANIAQISAPADLAGIFDMITAMAAKLVGKVRKRLVVGAPADLVILNACSTSDAVAEIAPALTA